MKRFLARVLTPVITFSIVSASLFICFESEAFARGKRSSKGKKPGSREMNIVREAKYTKDRSDINFESENLYGQRKMPMSSMIGQTKSDKRFDLIKIRDDWNSEMVQSTSTLEVGR